jgi:hypothetical protein
MSDEVVKTTLPAIPHNVGICTIYMKNIDQKTVDLQRKVVEKFNPNHYPHYSILVDMPHGHALDLCWVLNGQKHPTFPPKPNQNIPKRFDHDILLFLDVDAVPLNDKAIDVYVNKAADGHLVGNIQRSNHIQNDEHVFAAPSVYAMSTDIFLTLNRPSATPTTRGDVAEEITYAAELRGVPIDLYMPLRYDLMPSENHPWALKTGMPQYGCHTTFGSAQDGELFWHSFQIFHRDNQSKFWGVCEKLLNDNKELNSHG